MKDPQPKSFIQKRKELLEKITVALETVRGVGKNDPCPCLKRRAGAPPARVDETGKPVSDGHGMKFKHCCWPKIQQLRRIKLSNKL
jgi:hypothetical protein